MALWVTFISFNIRVEQLMYYKMYAYNWMDNFQDFYSILEVSLSFIILLQQTLIG